MRKDIENRPLLQGKDLSDLYNQIFQSRKNLYSQADLRVEVNNEDVEEVAKQIVYGIYKKITN